MELKCVHVFLVLLSAFTTSFAAQSPKGLDLGGRLPPFNLPGVDGKMHMAKEYADAKVLVLMFICNHCPTAQA